MIGVIYVDNRIHSGMFQQSDFELISAFANQAAVAINNAQLFDDLQESNEELEIAYQATLEGWVRALDLRDRETEGHSRRVVEYTTRLAETYEAKVQFRKFTETLIEGCGPGCGTEEAKGQGGCESCTSCAVASACGAKR